MIEFGVKYTLHTDAGVMLTPIDQFAIGMRAAALELRLTPDEVLTAITRTAAQALSLAGRGIVARGKRADLVIVEGNPLQDVAVLENVRAVMKEGKWYPGETHLPVAR
jgi:imidazolonepropionase-like amidohydrolase